ncbi:MAG: hypothetical protein HFF17_14835 [Oscillospiraceae bacterium]|nr:hypothetical protein [Oscillospiraceae bacterium]
MNAYRLATDELLDKSHMPVLMILNAIDEKRFLAVLESISKGIGFGEENGVCTFPNDLDEFDKANGIELDGVEFGLYSGETVIISYRTLYHYLKILSDNYVSKNSEQADAVKNLLSDYLSSFVEVL